jgi:hypothetical protein
VTSGALGGTVTAAVVVVVVAATVVVVVMVGLGDDVVLGAGDVEVLDVTVDGDGGVVAVAGAGESGGDVVGVSGGVDESEGSELTVVSDVVEDVDVSDVVEVVDVSDVVVVVVSDVGASTTGTGSQVKGDDGRTGSGSPGGSVAAGFCSTTL